MWPDGNESPLSVLLIVSNSSGGRGRATISSRIALGTQITAAAASTSDSTGRPASQKSKTNTTQTAGPTGEPVSRSPTSNSVSQPKKLIDCTSSMIERSMLGMVELSTAKESQTSPTAIARAASSPSGSGVSTARPAAI